MKNALVWIGVACVALYVTGHAPSLGAVGSVVKSLQPHGSLGLAGGGTTKLKAGIVAQVIDGDTLLLADGRKVRLVQIDTPELHGTPECAGAQASAYLNKQLPPGAPVSLEGDKTAGAIDRYDRVLAYVIVKRADQDVNLNVAMVEAGWAAPYFYDGQKGVYAAKLLEAAKSAWTQHLGLWGHCPVADLNENANVQSGPANAYTANIAR